MEQLKKAPVQPLLLTVPQVAGALGLSRTKIYELIDKEGLPVVRFGRAVRIPSLSLQQWVAQREQQSTL